MADPTPTQDPNGVLDTTTEVLGCEGPWFKDGPEGRHSHLVKGEVSTLRMFRRFTNTCGVGEIGHCWGPGDIEKEIAHARQDGVGMLVATLMDSQVKERTILLKAGFFEICRFKNDFTFHKNDTYMLTLYGKDMQQPGNPVRYPPEKRLINR